MRSVAVRIPEELDKLLDRLSEELRLSKSEILRSIIEEVLVRFEFSLTTRSRTYLMLRSCLEAVRVDRGE